jgi:hypothetical protein
MLPGREERAQLAAALRYRAGQCRDRRRGLDAATGSYTPVFLAVAVCLSRSKIGSGW